MTVGTARDGRHGGTMTSMGTVIPTDVEAIARAAGLDEAQTQQLRSTAASRTMEDMAPTPAELAAGAEILAGRIDFDEYCRRLGV